MKLGPAAAYLAMAFSVILVTFVGCGGGPDIELAQVSGTVQLDGKPIQSGTISFIPLDLAGPTAGAQIIDGAYFIGGENGVYIGECRVEISAMKKTGEKVPSPIDPNEMTDVTEELIPAKYNVKSTLTKQIQAGENLNVDFSLQSNVENE